MITIYRVYYAQGESFNEFTERAAAEAWRDLNAPEAEISTLERDLSDADMQA